MSVNEFLPANCNAVSLMYFLCDEADGQNRISTGNVEFHWNTLRLTEFHWNILSSKGVTSDRSWDGWNFKHCRGLGSVITSQSSSQNMQKSQGMKMCLTGNGNGNGLTGNGDVPHRECVSLPGMHIVYTG